MSGWGNRIKVQVKQKFYGPRVQRGGAYGPSEVVVHREVAFEPDGVTVVQNEPMSITIDSIAGSIGPFTAGDARALAERLEQAAEILRPRPKWWTVFGHWEGERIVVRAVVEGEHPDDTEQDDEIWPDGLFCDTEQADTAAEAVEKIRAEYEISEDEEEEG